MWVHMPSLQEFVCLKKKKRISTLLILAMVAMTRSDPGNARHRLECEEKFAEKVGENQLKIF